MSNNQPLDSQWMELDGIRRAMESGRLDNLSDIYNELWDIATYPRQRGDEDGQRLIRDRPRVVRRLAYLANQKDDILYALENYDIWDSDKSTLSATDIYNNMIYQIMEIFDITEQEVATTAEELKSKI